MGDSDKGAAREARIDALGRALAATQDENDRLKAELAAHEGTLREVTHRAKNTLHLIGSLLSLQRNRTDDPAAQRILDTAVERIAVLGRVHAASLDPQQALSSRALIGDLCHDLAAAHAASGAVTVDCQADDLPVPIETAVPMALVVNELLGNSLRHAFPDGRTGTVTVRYRESAPGHRRLTVADDGTGVPADRTNAGFGLLLARVMASQLHGQLEMEPGPGARYVLDYEVRG